MASPVVSSSLRGELDCKAETKVAGPLDLQSVFTTGLPAGGRFERGAGGRAGSAGADNMVGGHQRCAAETARAHRASVGTCAVLAVQRRSYGISTQLTAATPTARAIITR
jgi:hypothetical protein